MKLARRLAQKRDKALREHAKAEEKAQQAHNLERAKDTDALYKRLKEYAESHWGAQPMMDYIRYTVKRSDRLAVVEDVAELLTRNDGFSCEIEWRQHDGENIGFPTLVIRLP